MLRSLYSGISGVKNQQAQLDVISNNIANVNTTGFKSNRITFADALSETISGARGTAGNFGGANPIQLGRGAVISSVDTNFKQGSLDSTSTVTDLALNGKGFFVVTDGSRNYYSRAGAFQIQEDGSLMSQGGAYYVMGRSADSDGKLPSTTSIENIVLPFGRKEPAKSTENIEMYCNLDRNASVVEEWIGGQAFEVDGDPAELSTDLANIDGYTVHLGDVIEITGTHRDGSKVMAGNNQTWTFTYGKDGTTVEDFISKINEAFESTDQINGGTASIDENGKLRLNANTAGENKMTILLTAKTTSNHVATTEVHTSENAFTAVQPNSINQLTEVTDSYEANSTVNITANGITEEFTFGTGNESLQDIVSFLNSGSFGSGKYVLQQGTANNKVSIVNLNDATDTVVFAGSTGGIGLDGATEFTLTANHQNASSSTDLKYLLNMGISNNKTIKIEGNNPDGAYKSATFTYGDSKDGTTVQDLLDKINQTFTGVTATLNSDGKIVLTNNSSGLSYSYIKLSSDASTTGSAGFNVNFTTESFTSSTAFTTGSGTVNATAATEINDMDSMATTPYQPGDVIRMAATTIDGSTKIISFTYGDPADSVEYDGTTLGDFVDKINNGNEFAGVTASISNGQIVFTDDDLNDTNNYTSFQIVEWKHSDGTENTGSGMAMAFTGTAGTNNSSISLPSFQKEAEGTTGRHSTSIDVYDNLGQKHKLDINYTQDTVPGSNKWYWEVVIDEGKINPHSGNSGTVTFNDDGSLRAFNYDNGDSLRFNVDGAGEVKISINSGTAGAFNGMTQLASESTNMAIEQDGYTLGVLNNITIDDQGVVSGIYSNGVTKTLAQIAIANFTNEGGLQKEGNSLYSSNGSSGNPILAWAGQNNKTIIKSGYLESSNVDLTDEFAKLIISQRALEANAKVIGTADTILSTIINNMKRS